MLVDETTGEVKWAVQDDAGEGSFSLVVISPNGRFVASVGEYGEYWTLWEAASGVVQRVGDRHDGTGACSCRAKRNGRRLDDDCPVVAHTRGLQAVAFSPCGGRLATGGHDRTVIFWDAQTGKAQHRTDQGDSKVWSLSFSLSGARLASGGLDGAIRVWDATTGALLRTIPQAYEGYATRVHFSPTNSSRLVSILGNAMISLFDVDSGDLVHSFAGSRFAVFSPDGRTIATAGGSDFSEVHRDRDFREVHLFDAETGALRSTMVSHCKGLSAVSFSIDGMTLASGSIDGACKVWDLSTGALLRTFNPGLPNHLVMSLSMGPDWVRDTQRGVAFAMGHHPRLGAGSRVLELEAGVVQMIVDRA